MKTKRLIAIFWLIGWFSTSLVCSFFFSAPSFQLSQILSRPIFPDLPLGADHYGRNLLHVILDASFLSMSFAVACVLVSTLLAMSIAAISPNLPRWLFRLMESVLEFFLSFPTLLVALTVAGYFGPSQITVALALILGSTPNLTRSLWVRSRELSNQEFIWAARSLGAGPMRLAIKHYFPQLYSLARVKFPSLISHALVAEASLSFLGLGFPAGRESWGSLLAQAKDCLIEAPHLSIGVGVPLVFSLLALDVISKSTLPRLP